MVDPATGPQLYSQNIDVDIPLCPHFFIPSTVSAIPDKNILTASTLGTAPIGFTLSGIPLRGPFTENLLRVDQDTSISMDT